MDGTRLSGQKYSRYISVGEKKNWLLSHKVHLIIESMELNPYCPEKQQQGSK